MGCCASVPAATAPAVDPRTLSGAPAPGEPVYSVDPSQPTPIRLSEMGPASKMYPTVPAAFRDVGRTNKSVVCFRYEVPDFETGKYKSETTCEFVDVTWGEYMADSRKVARALIALDFQPNGKNAVLLHGHNYPHYLVAFQGALAAGGVSVGSYPTNSAELCEDVALRASATVAVVDNKKNALKFLPARDRLPGLKHIVVYLDTLPKPSISTGTAEPAAGDANSDAAMIQKAVNDGYLITWEQFLAKGESTADAEVDKRIDAIQPAWPAIYCATSGTTAKFPKLCVLTHDNLSFEMASGITSVGIELNRDHSLVSFLPISHIASTLVDILFPVCGQFHHGFNVLVVFARTDALKGTLMKTVAACEPSIAFFVPRLWSKLMAAMQAKAAEDPPTGCKKLLVDGAKEAGKVNARNRMLGGSGATVCCTCCYSCTVHSKIKGLIGMRNVVATYTGSAPTTTEVLDFVAAIGLPPLHSVYGQSENVGVATTGNNLIGVNSYGTNGPAIPGCELKIDHVEGRDAEGEGEVLIRGRNVMRGYLNDEESTKAAIDEQGFLHTGDLGCLSRGCLVIKGRIKELYKTAAGEYCAPLPIEDLVRKMCPAVSTPVVIAEGRHFVTLLVTLQQKPDLENGTFYDELDGVALKVDEACKTWQDAAKSDKWRAYIQSGVDAWNKVAQNTANRVQKFRIVTELSVPAGTLTPTLKVKRPAVADKYAATIDEMYKGTGEN